MSMLKILSVVVCIVWCSWVFAEDNQSEVRERAQGIADQVAAIDAKVGAECASVRKLIEPLVRVSTADKGEGAAFKVLKLKPSYEKYGRLMVTSAWDAVLAKDFLERCKEPPLAIQVAGLADYVVWKEKGGQLCLSQDGGAVIIANHDLKDFGGCFGGKEEDKKSVEEKRRAIENQLRESLIARRCRECIKDPVWKWSDGVLFFSIPAVVEGRPIMTCDGYVDQKQIVVGCLMGPPATPNIHHPSTYFSRIDEEDNAPTMEEIRAMSLKNFRQVISLNAENFKRELDEFVISPTFDEKEGGAPIKDVVVTSYDKAMLDVTVNKKNAYLYIMKISVKAAKYADVKDSLVRFEIVFGNGRKRESLIVFITDRVMKGERGGEDSKRREGEW